MNKVSIIPFSRLRHLQCPRIRRHRPLPLVPRLRHLSRLGR